ncbi:MAG: hypothetical protein QOK31_184 [Solirubrobacteraceae bacterium]|nr:hypothetical protein [Solirubrobacteraceae bacterium]
MAAVLAAGPGAVLSHRSAAALWSLRRYDGTPEATVWPRRRSRAGLRLHAAALPADEVTEHDGIPVTTPARTLLDLASILDPSAFERALHEAEVQRLHGPLSLVDLLTRHAGARGTGALRKALNRALIGIDITRSELEHRFLAFLDDQKLPRPRSNAILPLTDRTIEADCVWTPARLIVELDGHATHSTRRGFERDRARDRALQAVGWRVVRITWRQLHDDPSAVARDLRALLGG